MAFLVRSIHVGSLSFILGGALLLIAVSYLSHSHQPRDVAALLRLMQAYEFGFWAAMGLIVATGIGNLAHFGDGLPAPESTWGGRLLVKLLLVFALLLLSCVRGMALSLVTAAPGAPPRALSALQGLYAATVVLVMAIGGLAVALAHF